ncbi:MULTISPECIES: twin-arginine translocation signal domain-containing protein [unclassified Cupriavidus]|nr:MULTISPECIES: twin-arginine translocation signal domain-containing protein [unclassified Cupriavidus]MCA3183010.1 twin-arginine translocation signal domain-containing protein [Cupriavidus sp.]MCA3230814.1 twin-arginine translocation signal domain-containing protein [Cupriavidus sp.]QWE97327.1 twin-arginine translocation signal domain-containing protein [Cupriavidus sp. EM10]
MTKETDMQHSRRHWLGQAAALGGAAALATVVSNDTPK